MKIIKYISTLLVSGITIVSCEREGRPVVPEDGRLIVFTADSHWPEMTKATLFDRDDIVENGFKVWGTWHRDPEDHSDYVHDEDIFGTDGTLVLPVGDSESMAPENEATWHRGYYSFAAVFPASFTATQAASLSVTSEGDKYVNVLSFDLGTEGFNLADKQTDLMYAFSYADNSNDNASSVPLNFEHSFSKVNISLTYTSVRPEITEVILYGIHSTVYGELRYRQDFSDGETDIMTQADNMNELLLAADVSSQQEPYARYSDFNETEGTITIAQDLLVFPESLSRQNALRIQIRCEDRDIYTEVNSGTWEPGETYTYLLNTGN